jgi:hypothetical protein
MASDGISLARAQSNGVLTSMDTGRYILAVCPGRGGNRFCGGLRKFYLRCQECAVGVSPPGWHLTSRFSVSLFFRYYPSSISVYMHN